MGHYHFRRLLGRDTGFKPVAQRFWKDIGWAKCAEVCNSQNGSVDEVNAAATGGARESRPSDSKIFRIAPDA